MGCRARPGLPGGVSTDPLGRGSSPLAGAEPWAGRRMRPMLCAGDDWAEDHHDVALVDAAGRRLARARLSEGVAGIARFHELIAEHAAEGEGPGRVVVGIETDRG